MASPRRTSRRHRRAAVGKVRRPVGVHPLDNTSEDPRCQPSLSTISRPFLLCPTWVPDARIRPVRSITTAPAGFEGEGFPVRRAFAGVNLADLDPFIHMDQMGEVDYGPGEPRGTAWHPHRGFETVTYMIDGVFQHKDSTGGGGLITNGDTQWMTAGGGILHIERPPESMVETGGLFHGIQLWVNLPSKDKMVDAALPGHPEREGHAAVVARRRRARSHHRRRRRRSSGTRHHPHADRARPRHGRAVRSARAAVAAAVQRARVRAQRSRLDRRRRPIGGGPARGARRRRRDPHRGRSDAGQPHAELRRARPRGPADPRAGCGVRTVRDEHPRRARRKRSRTTRPDDSDTCRQAKATDPTDVRTRGRTGGRRGRA